MRIEQLLTILTKLLTFSKKCIDKKQKIYLDTITGFLRICIHKTKKNSWNFEKNITNFNPKDKYF
jgi:hypothetical protein